MKRLICIVIGVALLLQTVLLGGCAPGSQANKQAGKGATTGAVGGAVAGGLGSILFGGSFGRGLAAGAAIGAASGAATGAVSGAMADKDASRAPAKKAPPSTAPSTVNMGDFKDKLGAKNGEAATALAQCRHSDAIATAAEAYSTSTDARQKAYALFIQAVSAEEQGDKRIADPFTARSRRPIPNPAGSTRCALTRWQGVIKLQKIRKDNGLAPVCPGA